MAILTALRLYLYTCFYYPSIVYSPGNTLFWISSDNTIIFLGAGLLNFLGRLSEYSTGTGEIIVHVIFIAVKVFFILYITLMRSFIKEQSNTILIGVLIGGLLVSICQIIQKLDQEDLNSTELREQLTLCQNEVRNHRHNDQKIRRLISKILRFESSDETIQIVKTLIDAVKHFKKQQKKSGCSSHNDSRRRHI